MAVETETKNAPLEMDTSLNVVDSPHAVSGVFSDTGGRTAGGTGTLSSSSSPSSSAASAASGRLAATRASTAADSLAGLISSGSMVLRQEREASCWRPPEVTGNGAVPYLDVMTVNTAQFPKSLDGDMFGTHTRLLIEPISIPNLKHTGVDIRPLPTKVNRHRAKDPLFYPDGGKKVHLRMNIQDSLKQQLNMQSGQFSSTAVIGLDEMEHWNNDGGSRLLDADTKSSNGGRRGGVRRSGGSGKGSKKGRATVSTRARKQIKAVTTRRGPLASVRSSRPGARQRTAETRAVLESLHGTLSMMDRAVSKA
jgi:hypothetical protein